MEFTGKFKGISNDFVTNELTITFTVNEKSSVTCEYEKIKDCEKLSIKATKYRNRRSHDANAYMWVLLQKMAEVLHTTKDELYLKALAEKGVFTHIVVKPNMVDRVINEWKTVRNLGEVTINGQTGIQLQCYFGSSTYDTKEMSVLLEWVVEECKELNIETLPTEEIQRMKNMWGADEKVI